MRGVDLYLQTRMLLRPIRGGPITPRVIATCRYIQDPTHQRHRILSSHLLHHRVPGSDSFAQDAAAVFTMSRSILTAPSSRFVLVNSISISVSGFWHLPISASFPACLARSQFPTVDGGHDNLRAAAGIVMFPSVTSFTASSRHSFVYLPCGIPFILTPPSLYFTRLWCPVFPSYL